MPGPAWSGSCFRQTAGRIAHLDAVPPGQSPRPPDGRGSSHPTGPVLPAVGRLLRSLPHPKGLLQEPVRLYCKTGASPRTCPTRGRPHRTPCPPTLGEFPDPAWQFADRASVHTHPCPGSPVRQVRVEGWTSLPHFYPADKFFPFYR